MISVVHLLPRLDSQTGGMERQASQVAAALAERNCNVIFVTCAYWARMRKDRLKIIDLFGGVPIYRIPIFRGWRLINALLFFLGGVIILILLKNRYTIIHAHQIHTSGLIACALKGLLPSRRVIIKNPAGGEFGDLKQIDQMPCSRLIKRFLLRMTDIFIGVSEETINEMADAGFQPLKLIPNGVNTKLFAPVGAEEKLEMRNEILGSVAYDYIALFVGRLGPEKNVFVLLNAVARLKLNVLLLVVGEGALRGELQEYASTRNIQQQVVFLGSVRDVHRFYQIADVFILPSLSEGLPNVLLEAMSCGTPPIGSDIASIRSLIEHKHNGYLFRNDEPKDLEQAMTDILTNRQLAHALSQNSRKSVEDGFSLDRVADEYLGLYESLVS